MRVAADTSVLLLLLDSSKAAEQSEQRALVTSWLAANKAELVIPTPVLTELLARLGPEQRATLAGELKGKFEATPLDTKGAVLAADAGGPERGSKTRQEIKFDAIVVGAAAAAKLPLLTLDGDQVKMAGRIKAPVVDLKAA